MTPEVQGHSGCLIKVVNDGNNLFVLKGTTDPGYFNRLVAQARKQQAASEVAYQHIRVPRIHSVEQTAEQVVVKMDYVYSKNFVEHFENSGFEQIDYFTRALIYFVEKELEHSPVQTVPSKVVTDKFADVYRKVMRNPALAEDAQVAAIMERSEIVMKSLGNLDIPVGQCHGDLTFSNILFNGNNYFLIDFLDSFIESPMLDLVKIRQDSAHRWSQLMFTRKFDQVRLRIICDYIDSIIDGHFSKYTWYRDYYLPLQILNFLRILQYAHNEEVISYLKRELSDLLQLPDKL